jgi:hypothetical protein
VDHPDRRTIVVAAVTAALAAACGGSQTPVPEIASSSESLSYALEWSARVDAVRQRYEQRAEQAKIEIAAIPSYHEQLTEPVWPGVVQIVEQADEAGRSRALVEVFRESQDISAFVEDNEKNISWAVSRHVKASLEKHDCSCEHDVGRGAGNAVIDSTRRALLKRQRELNEAYRLLDEGVHGANEQDTRALQTQIDAITGTSNFLYVEAYDLAGELDVLLDETRRVRRTLDKALAAERESLEGFDGTKAEEKALREHIELVEKAREPVDEVSDTAREVRDRMDAEILELQTSYADAINQLLDELQSR